MAEQPLRYATTTPEMYRQNSRAALLDLHEREVLLPPDVPGMHADKVIGVHHSVDKSVQHDGKVDVAVVPRVHIQPVELRVERRGTKAEVPHSLNQRFTSLSTPNKKKTFAVLSTGRRGDAVSTPL